MDGAEVEDEGNDVVDGERPDPPTEPDASNDPPGSPRRRLYREREEKKLTGVCGGVADYLGVDPTIVRLALVVLTLSTRAAAVVYLIAAVVMPERPPDVPRVQADRQLFPRSLTPHLVFALVIGAFLLLADDHWWFEAPVLGLALIGLGIWFLVDDHEDLRRRWLPASFHGSDIFRENPNARSDNRTTLLTEVAPERAHAGPPASEDTPGSTADKTDDEPQPVPVPPDLSTSVPDDSAHRAGPQGEVPPPVPPWGLGILTEPEPPPASGGRHRRRGPVILLGVLCVAAGAFASFALFDVFDVSVELALSGTLVILGLGLVVGAWLGQARALIGVGLLVGGPLLLSDVADFPLSAGNGERTVIIDERSDLDETYELMTGELVLDLRDLPLAGEGSDGDDVLTVDAEVALGNLHVILPDDVTAQVDALVHGGDIQGPGGVEESGIYAQREFLVEGRAGAERIHLDLKVGGGQIEVRRG